MLPHTLHPTDALEMCVIDARWHSYTLTLLHSYTLTRRDAARRAQTPSTILYAGGVPSR